MECYYVSFFEGQCFEEHCDSVYYFAGHFVLRMQSSAYFQDAILVLFYFPA